MFVSPLLAIALLAGQPDPGPAAPASGDTPQGEVVPAPVADAASRDTWPGAEGLGAAVGAGIGFASTAVLAVLAWPAGLVAILTVPMLAGMGAALLHEGPRSFEVGVAAAVGSLAGGVAAVAPVLALTVVVLRYGGPLVWGANGFISAGQIAALVASATAVAAGSCAGAAWGAMAMSGVPASAPTE
ncbi:MAG: hypothetical protein IT382_24810 [Deltaproteobacteria bacterium]|nr:hypothetical protein [Deltaproteobacteria bacterium]